MRPRFVAGDILTGKLISNVPFATYQFRSVLGGPGGWTATIPHDDPKISGPNRRLLTPNRSTIWVIDDGVPPLFGGIVRQPSADAADVGTEDLTIGGDGFWGYYRGNGSDIGRMWIDPDQLIPGSVLVDGVFNIIKVLLNATNAHGDIGIKYAFNVVRGPDAANQQMLQADASNIGTVIETLCTDYGVAFDTDFSWDTTVDPWLPVATLSFSVPRRGRDTAIVLEHGRNVDYVSWAADGFTQANHVLGIGQGALRADAISSEPGYPVIDATHVDKTITAAGRLTTATNASLQARLGVSRTARVQVRPTADGKPTLTPQSLKTGDTVELVIDSGYIQESGERWRVDAVEVNYDLEGELNPLAFELSTNATTARAVTPPAAAWPAAQRAVRLALAELQRLT